MTAAGAVLSGPRVPVEAPYGLPGLIRDQARRTPGAVAAEDDDRRLDYAELDRLGDRLADDLLRGTGGRRGVVAVRLPRGVDLLVAVLGVLKAGCAYLPVGLEDPPERTAAATEDARPLAVVHGGEALPDCLAHLPGIAVPSRPLRAAQPRPLDPVPPDTPVYVMFTSGSTGRPKGVVVPSGALCNRIAWMQRQYRLTPADRVLQKTPFTFDVSGWELFWPLVAGARCSFAPEGAHRDPGLVAELIQSRSITVCHFVPSMLREFLTTAGVSGCGNLRHVFCSGEALPAPVAAAFRSTLPARLHNLYGPTEAAIDVTHWTVPEPFPPESTVLLGAPVDNLDLDVRDANGRPAAEGELWISGVQLALGYAGRPELTAEAFPEVDGVRWYRTGDRVRLTPAGLEFLGRLDDQVKVRGVRVEPAEVERALRSHPAVAEAVAVPVCADPGRGVELLAAVSAPPSAVLPTDPELRTWLAGRLPREFVPAAFHLVDDIPLTASGKTDRRAMQQRLAGWWQERLRATGGGAPELDRLWWRALGRPGADGDDDTAGFLTLGGHSLLAVRLVATARERLGVDIPATMLLRDNSSLAELRAYASAAGDADAAEPEGAGSPATGPDGATVPLAPGQRRLWLLSEVSPDAAAYNVVSAVLVAGRVDEAALRAAVSDVGARRDVLRARVGKDGEGAPVLVFGPEPLVRLEVQETERLTEHDAARFAEREHLRTIDPAGAGLGRVVLLRCDTARPMACLLLSLHHLVADQRTVELVLADLAAAYAARVAGRAPDLPPAPAYADLCRRAVGEVGGARWQDDLRYWQAVLADAPARSELPFRRRPEGTARLRGRGRTAAFGPARTTAFDALAAAEGVTPAIVLTTCVAVLIGAWSGQDTVVLGMPASRRLTEADDRTAGLFLATLPLRVDLADHPDLRSLLVHVRARQAEAFAHSLPPFDEVVREFGARTSPQENPLFQVWVNDLTRAAVPPVLAGTEMRAPVPAARVALFDLNFYLRRAADGYRLELTDAVDRFPPGLGDEALRQSVAVVDQLLERPDRPWADLDLGDARPAPSAPPPSRERSVRELVDRIVTRDPDRIALTGPAGSLRYGDLAAGVAETSAQLRDAGVRPGHVVEIRAHRTAALPVALLAAWQAGAAVALVDGALPAARLRSQAGLLDPAARIATGGNRPEVTAAAGRRRLDGISHLLSTSGTTGDAVLVAVRDGTLGAALDWYERTLAPGPDDRVALLGGPGHDPVLRDVLVPLLAGGTLVVPGDDAFRPDRLRVLLASAGVTILHGTPALLELLLAGGPPVPTPRLVISGGAPLRWGLVRRLRAVMPTASIINAYGTTETPQIIACHHVSAADLAAAADADQVPVGRGVAGAEVWVRASSGRPAGPGQLGEVVVRGRQVAAGYLESSDIREIVDSGPVPDYRTGDLGRIGLDGLVHLDRRADRQVLLGGFRLAPEEVESAALRHGDVEQALATVEDRPAGPVLTLLVVSGSGRLDPDRVREYLRGLLPRPAVPAVVRVVTRLGTDANLKPTAVGGGHPGPAVRAPVAAGPAPGEGALAEISRLVEDVLGRPVGVRENLFDAGLTSLHLVRLHERLRAAYGGVLPIAELFGHPHVEALAALFTDASAAGDGPVGDPPGPPGPATATGAARRRARELVRREERMERS